MLRKSKPELIKFSGLCTALVLAAALLLGSAGSAGARIDAAGVVRVSADTLTTPGAQHATQVEQDAAASGSTLVSVFQVGRFFNGGATDIGFARSGDGGATWGSPGFLPGLTFTSGAAVPYERVSDPSVAYYLEDVEFNGRSTWHGPVAPKRPQAGGSHRCSGSCSCRYAVSSLPNTTTRLEASAERSKSASSR